MLAFLRVLWYNIMKYKAKRFFMKNIFGSADTPLSKKLFRAILLTVYPAYILHSLLFSPIYTVLYSDIGVNPVIPILLYFLLVLIDLFAFFIAFSVIIYGLCRYPAEKIKKVFALVFLAPLFKYLLKMAVSPFIDGIPTASQLSRDIFTLATSYLLEVLQFLIVLLLTFSAAKRYRERRATVVKAAAEISESTHLIPFKRLISFKNPLQYGAFISSFVIIFGRVASLAISDLSKNWKISGINGYISFFTPYVMEIVVGAIGYFFMLYVFITIYSKLDKE